MHFEDDSDESDEIEGDILEDELDDDERERHDNRNDDDGDDDEDEEESETEESESESESEKMHFVKRSRRQRKEISYRFTEYDEMIKNAIQGEAVEYEEGVYV